jgi:spermidine synthase
VEDELGLVLGPDLEVEVGDARLHLRAHAGDDVDLVVGDAFGSRSVPWHLTTREFLATVDEALANDGLYALNMIDGREQRFARAEAATLADVFAYVAVLGRPRVLEGASSGNYVMVASQQSIDVDAIGAALRAGGDDGFQAYIGRSLTDWIAGAEVLTDDFAPVDRLISPPG